MKKKRDIVMTILVSIASKISRNVPGLKNTSSNKFTYSRVKRYITQRYLLAVLLVFMVTILGSILLYNSISVQNLNAHIINVAGAQRMHLQRIAVLTRMTYFEDVSEQSKPSLDLLLASVDNMNKQHHQLDHFLKIHKNSSQESKLLQAHYFSEPVKLHEQMLQFTQLLHVFINSGATDENIMNQITTQAIGPLLDDVEKAVGLFQINAEKDLVFTSIVLEATTSIVILILMCQIIFIFRPLARQLAEQASDLEKKATIDDLTGLLNRSAFAARCSKIIENAQQSGESASLITLDLDWFKEINQRQGYKAGDAVLTEIGRRLHDLISNNFEISRLGGDEFAIIFTHNMGPEWSLERAEKIRQSTIEPIEYEGRQLFVTATLGVASFPKDATNINELLQAANYALSLAKQQDRGTVQPFLQAQHHEIERDKIILQSLERREHLDGLFIEFQPLIDLQTQHITGCEALVRWNHPVLGRIAPDQFLKLVISHGHGAFIGEIIRRRAMQGFKELRLAGIPIKTLSMNLMDVELKSLSGPQELIEQLSVFGLTPQDIEIEVTEDVVLDRYSGDLDRKLYGMRSAGFRLALDDFGTGFASLEHLVKLEVDVIKIDRTFVAKITRDPRSIQIINAIIKLAHGLSAKVVAEGIETIEQLELLKSLSCDIGQGYLLARPMPVSELLLWYREYQLTNIKVLA